MTINYIFKVNVPGTFAENDEFLKNVNINGQLTVKGKTFHYGDIDALGRTLNLSTGKVIASNVIYSITAGKGEAGGASKIINAMASEIAPELLIICAAFLTD